MAPPQVDLGKKQPLEDVQGWAEKVGDQKMPPLAPTQVAVETGAKVAGKKMCGKKRCKVLIVGLIVGAILAAGITTAAFLIHRHRHHWRGHVESHDGHHAEENVRTEGTKQLLYVARNETNHFFRMEAVLDYGSQMAGFKDCSSNRCFVDKLHESYDQGCARWRQYRHHSRRPEERPLAVVSPAVNSDLMHYLAGDAIQRLCAGVPAFWVMPLDGPRANGTDVIYL